MCSDQPLRYRLPMQRTSARTGRIVLFVVAGVVAAIIGALIRGLFPPFGLDDAFWRAFWSGPPAAGLFAIVAAIVAFFPAYRSTRIARATAAREQWWNRAEWALGLAVSDAKVDREVANSALEALSGEATEMEFKMILRVIENLQGASALGSGPRAAGRWSEKDAAVAGKMKPMSSLQNRIASGEAEPISDLEREQLQQLRSIYVRRFDK